MMKQRIYLDNSATTQVDEAVLQAMLPCFRETFGNASSVHIFGQEARAKVTPLGGMQQMQGAIRCTGEGGHAGAGGGVL
jgi:cysteine desulfurase